MTRPCDHSEEDAAQAQGSFFKVTGCASPDTSSPAVCGAHRCRRNRYIMPGAGLRPQRGLRTCQGCFLQEVVAGPEGRRLTLGLGQELCKGLLQPAGGLLDNPFLASLSSSRVEGCDLRLRYGCEKEVDVHCKSLGLPLLKIQLTNGSSDSITYPFPPGT